MKRFVFAAAALAVSAGLFTSVASASVGAKSSSKVARTVTEWTATYDASQYYGGVTCTGKTIVSAKYPEGKEVETCESTELHLTRHAGRQGSDFLQEHVGRKRRRMGIGLRQREEDD